MDKRQVFIAYKREQLPELVSVECVHNAVSNSDFIRLPFCLISKDSLGLTNDKVDVKLGRVVVAIGMLCESLNKYYLLTPILYVDLYLV